MCAAHTCGVENPQVREDRDHSCGIEQNPEN